MNEPVLLEHGLALRQIRGVYRYVEVGVLAGLPADERVDSPPTFDDHANTAATEKAENVLDICQSDRLLWPQRSRASSHRATS
jgi:hypothetical protein